MSAFNFKKYIVDTVKKNTVDLGVTIVKSTYYQTTNTIKTVAKKAKDTITGLPKLAQEKFDNIPNDIANIPVAPGLSIEKFFTAITDPAGNKDDFTKSIEAFTGVNIGGLIDGELNSERSQKEIQLRIDEFTGALRRQVMFEIQHCIERYLRGIVNKNLDVFQLINFEDYIANQIAKLRNKIRFKIQSQIEKLFFDKLKIQQIALLKQQILQEIRKICPDSHAGSTRDISPSLTKRLQSDNTWTAADSTLSIQESSNTRSLQLAAKAQRPGSTGQQVIDITDDTMVGLRVAAENQATGYDDSSVDQFVSQSGEVVLS